MKKILILGLAFFAHQATAEDVIYKLSKADYSRIPTYNHFDRFHHCLDRPQGVYCTAHANVVSDEPSELLDMMRAYSAVRYKHINYTHLVYGLCLTNRCKAYYNGSDSEEDLRRASEACLNATYYAEYGLKARVTELNCYFDAKSRFEKDWIDWAVALLLLGILVINFVGTVYDVYRDRTKPANGALLAFSIRENWIQMVAPPPSNPRVAQLRAIHGIRVLTSFLVVLGHVPLSLMHNMANPSWIENAYEVTAYHILAQGHLIVLTFFLISGFLLAYNSKVQLERGPITMAQYPKAILSRWLRLTPINIVSLLITATWMRFTDSGPLWHEVIGKEVQDCRNDWIYNLFYVNNFIDNSQCILQTWYLACDMQLHVIGLLIIVLAPTTKARYWCLAALYGIGLAWPAYNIITMDLDGTLLASPTIMSEFFITDPAFNYLYKRTYGNMPVFVLGMLFGDLVYDWQKRDVFSMELRKYRFIYWTLYPLLLAVSTTAGFLFYADAPRASLAVRLAFAPIVKPLFVSIVMLIILGAMFKVETLYRGVMEWNGWVPMARISYCIYAVHVGVIRYLGGTRTTLVHFSSFHLLQDYMGVIAITCQVAFVFYLLVEAPFNQLVKIYLSPAPKAKVNGAAANGTAINGTTKNGTAVNGTAVNGTPLNGTAVNGSAVNGTALNGNAVNGTALNGNALNGHAVVDPVTNKDKDA